LAEYAPHKLASFVAQWQKISIEMQVARSFMRKHTNRKKVRNKMRGKLRKQAAKQRPAVNGFNNIVQFNNTLGGDPIELPDGSIATEISLRSLQTQSLTGDVTWDGDVVVLPGGAINDEMVKTHMQPHLAYLVNLARRSIEQVGICQQDSVIGATVYSNRSNALKTLMDTGDYLQDPSSGWAHFIAAARTTAAALVKRYRSTTAEVAGDLVVRPLCNRAMFWLVSPLV
jgi:hypothetical protein